LRCNKRENFFSLCVLQPVQHLQEVDGEPGFGEGVSEVHAGEEEGVLPAEAAVG
jgi:hypothetical protein